MSTYTTSKAGTSYPVGMDPELVEIMDAAIAERRRVRIHYGAGPEGGPVQDWMEEHGVIGYLSRSMGPRKEPILLANRASIGGPSVLSGCIVRIHLKVKGGNGYKEVWRDPHYVEPVLTMKPYTPPPDRMEQMGLTTELWSGHPGANGSKVVARGNKPQMVRLRGFLLGQRMSK